MSELYGLKYWYVIVDPNGLCLLHSPYTNMLWVPKQWSTAICPTGCNSPPHKECTCGIYATKKPLPFLSQVSGLAIIFYGRLKLAGVVQEYERGFRAQYAYPQTIDGIINPPIRGDKKISFQTTWHFCIDCHSKKTHPLCWENMESAKHVQGGLPKFDLDLVLLQLRKTYGLL